MSDDFTKTKFAWLLQIASDPSLSGSTPRLAIYIACKFLSRKTQTAWPGQYVLAELLGIRTREGVRRCIDQLVAGGHLAVDVSHGRGFSNRYRIILKDIAAQEDPDETEPDDKDDLAEASPPKTTKSKSSATESLFPDDPPPAKAKAKAKAPPASAIDEAFNLWWDQYPKRAGKKDAVRKIYRRIISKGEASSEELLAGAMRYAAAVTGKDPQYTKYPAGWLNDARWTDEHRPAPSVQFGASSRSQQPQRRSYVDIALEGYQRDEE
jgi:hypothetical protein